MVKLEIFFRGERHALDQGRGAGQAGGVALSHIILCQISLVQQKSCVCVKGGGGGHV